mgnify:CR=1 FL=1
MTRETLLAERLVALADTLVTDFDVIELLTTLSDSCVELLHVDAAGIMVAEPDGDLQVMASSSDEMRMLELYQIQKQEGPCLESFQAEAPVLNQNLDSTADQRWPNFAPEARARGFAVVHALPMRRPHGSPIGALNLFDTEAREIQPDDVAAAQAMANVATIALFQHRAALEAQLVNGQLHHALDNRVVIEQAKGVLAERHGVDIEDALACLRNHARNHNLRLAALASDIVDGTLSGDDLDPLVL